MKKTTALASSLLILIGASTSAVAHQAGEWVLRVGIATVEPDESSDDLELDGTALAGTGVGVGNDTQLGLTATYMVTDNFGIEILAATPFEHDLLANAETTTATGVEKIGTVEHLPPTVSAQYFFMNPSSNFQPYAGIGINYTLILDETLSSEMKAAPINASKITLDDSVGLSLQLGMDYQINQKWLVNAAIWRIDLQTDAKIETALGTIKADVDVDPYVYMLSMGYKF